jgi:hypothetical protein
MPVRDQVSDQEVEVAGINLALDDNETNAGSIIDTADYDLGVYFLGVITAWVDGTHTLLIEEGDDSGLSDAATVATAKLIGALPAYTAIHANGDTVLSVGVHSTKRYVRASFVSTGVTTGATGSLFAVKGGELLKTASTS